MSCIVPIVQQSFVMSAKNKVTNIHYSLEYVFRQLVTQIISRMPFTLYIYPCEMFEILG